MTTKNKTVSSLTDAERDALQEHELTISQGVKAFIAVGMALLAIRDGKLYRADYKTFEEYCQERWNFGARRGRQLIDAAVLAEEMGTDCSHLELENEGQARALAAVPPHLRKEVLTHIHDAGDKPTEQSVTKAVNALLERKRAEAKERERNGAPEEEDEGSEDGDDNSGDDTEHSGEDDESDAGTDADTSTNTDHDPRESPTERTLRRTAAKHEKERLYLARGLEHLRLAVKDLRKVRATDLETEESQQAAREGLDSADNVFSDVRGWLRS